MESPITASGGSLTREQTLIPSNPQEMRPATPAELRESQIAVARQTYPDLTDDEALSYMASSQALAELAYQLQDGAEESYARYVVHPSSSFSATIDLKSPDAEALALIEDADIPGVLVDATALYNETEQLDVVHEAVESLAPGELVRGVSADYNWDSDTVEVIVDPMPGLSLEDVTAVAPQSVTLDGTVAARGGDPVHSTKVSYSLGDA